MSCKCARAKLIFLLGNKNIQMHNLEVIKSQNENIKYNHQVKRGEMKPHSGIPPPEGNGKTLEEMSCRERRVRGTRLQANGLAERLDGGDSVLRKTTEGLRYKRERIHFH